MGKTCTTIKGEKRKIIKIIYCSLQILPKDSSNINQLEDNFFMEDPANVYSPTELISKLTTETKSFIQQQKPPLPPPSTILYRQRTNPFLVEAVAVNEEELLHSGEEDGEQEEEEDEGEEVIVRQEVGLIF